MGLHRRLCAAHPRRRSPGRRPDRPAAASRPVESTFQAPSRFRNPTRRRRIRNPKALQPRLRFLWPRLGHRLLALSLARPPRRARPTHPHLRQTLDRKRHRLPRRLRPARARRARHRHRPHPLRFRSRHRPRPQGHHLRRRPQHPHRPPPAPPSSRRKRRYAPCLFDSRDLAPHRHRWRRPRRSPRKTL
jgi:hypothetical protein